MCITYVLECVGFYLPFLFLKSHCKLAHLSGIFSILRFLSASPIQSGFPVLRWTRCVLSGDQGRGRDCGFLRCGVWWKPYGQHVGFSECKQKSHVLVRCVWYCEHLASVPRVLSAPHHIPHPQGS